MVLPITLVRWAGETRRKLKCWMPEGSSWSHVSLEEGTRRAATADRTPISEAGRMGVSPSGTCRTEYSTCAGETSSPRFVGPGF